MKCSGVATYSKHWPRESIKVEGECGVTHSPEPETLRGAGIVGIPRLDATLPHPAQPSDHLTFSNLMNIRDLTCLTVKEQQHTYVAAGRSRTCARRTKDNRCNVRGERLSLVKLGGGCTDLDERQLVLELGGGAVCIDHGLPDHNCVVHDERTSIGNE
jgi:hypothetical protein